MSGSPTTAADQKEATLLPDTLLEQVHELAEAYAKGRTCRLSAHLATSEAERVNHAARADFWDGEVSDLYAKLTAAFDAAVRPTIDTARYPFASVVVPDEHHVEIHGSGDGGDQV